MTAAQFTLGPRQANGLHVTPVDYKVGERNPYIVAKGPNAQANARLIAAAPDLYVVVDHPVLEWLCTDGLESIPEPERTSVRIFLIPLRAAALRKARGETP